MSVPMDPPYYLVYPTSYVKGVEPDHFDTRNSPVGMCLHCCVCRATLQFSNYDPKECTKYIRSHLILPCGAQYNDRLYPTILEPWNHHGLLIDPTMGEPYPMEVVGNFRAKDPIFKGCYGNSLLYSNADLARLRWWKIYLPAFQGEIPMPPAPSYQQVREPAMTKQFLAKGSGSRHTCGVPQGQMLQQQGWAPMRLQTQLQHLNSEALRFYVCQETLLPQGINPE